MYGSKGSTAISINMGRMSEVLSFFERFPDQSYSLRSLSGTFQNFDVHHYLVELEKNGALIRSKSDINGKPVTFWRLQEKIPPPNGRVSNQNFPSNFHQRRNAQDEFSDRFGESPFKKPKMADQMNYSSSPISISKYTISSSMTSTGDRCVVAPRRLDPSAPLEIMMRTLSISNDRPHHLNPNSPEFVPSYLKAPKSAQSSPIPKPEPLRLPDILSISAMPRVTDFRDLPKTRNLFDTTKSSIVKEFPDTTNETDAKELSEVNNLSTEFMTALTKNPVSVLYEFAQQRGMNCDIDCLEVAGPSHKPKISMVVTLNGRKFDTIVATSKKEGKRLAADAAIRKLISDGHFAERISRLSTRAAFKDGDINTEEINASKNSVSMLDKMASLVYKELAKILRELSSNEGKALAGRKVLSALIMQDEKHDTFQVVSLATGNRCISGDKISLQGHTVNDCHAEIVVRRSFMLFLYQQLNAHLSDSKESLDIFENLKVVSSTDRRFKLKAHIKFHLYISTAPCGDGALFCNRENGHNKTESEMILSKEHKPTFEHSVQGLLRSKIEGGEGTIPVVNTRLPNVIQSLDGILRGERLKTMSCSDKIARWNYLGIQGALLTQLIEPIYLQSISLGNLYNAGHLCRAVCCRLTTTNKHPRLVAGVSINHPDLGYVHVGDLQREIDKSNELSLNWCYGMRPEILDGVTGQLIGLQEKHLPHSRISKLSLFRQYFHLLKRRSQCPINDRITYREAKSQSKDYESKKQQLYEIFHKLDFGSWICKPSEQNNFTNQL